VDGKISCARRRLNQSVNGEEFVSSLEEYEYDSYAHIGRALEALEEIGKFLLQEKSLITLIRGHVR
jgi:hypothetical protein